MFRNINGTEKEININVELTISKTNLLLTTVLIECIKLKICAFADGCSPKP